VDLRVRRLGPNSSGKELSPGAMEDCYLGLLVDQPLAARWPAPGSLLVVGPTALLDARVRQPDGRAVYDLLTGHPDRSPRELVFVADLAVELRAWQDTEFATQGIDIDGVAEAVVQLARRGQVAARRWTTPAGSCATAWTSGWTSSTCAGCIPPAGTAHRMSRSCSTHRTPEAVQRGHYCLACWIP
jgi:hypothetical protein